MAEPLRDLVTLTDHDTIEGALSLAHLPDTFVSEEVTVLLESGRQLHVNVFGLDARQHEGLQARKADFEEEFLAGLRTGLTVPCGRSGSYARLTGEVARIFAAGYADTVRAVVAGAPDAMRVAASLALASFLPLIPLFTLGVYIHEQRFGARHFRAFQEVFGWPALPSGRPSTLGADSVGEAA